MRILFPVLFIIPATTSAALSYDASISGLVIDNNILEQKKFSADVRINQDGKYVYKYTRSESDEDLVSYKSNQFSLILNESNSGAMEIEYNIFETATSGTNSKESNYRVDIAQFRKSANVGYNYNSDPGISVADPIGQATSIYWSNFFGENAMLDMRYVMPRNSSGLREGVMLGFFHSPSYFGNYVSYSFSVFRPNKIDPMIIHLGVKFYMGKAKTLKQVLRNKF